MRCNGQTASLHFFNDLFFVGIRYVQTFIQWRLIRRCYMCSLYTTNVQCTITITNRLHLFVKRVCTILTSSYIQLMMFLYILYKDGVCVYMSMRAVFSRKYDVAYVFFPLLFFHISLEFIKLHRIQKELAQKNNMPQPKCIKCSICIG